ncbi:MAG: GHMP kinase [Bacteroidetes bacterium]|nr:GHMP kinase [Bacteroidota bacterium]
MSKSIYFSNGKLLLSGEYMVLNGAKALSVPTTKGQTMTVEQFAGSGNIHWLARDYNGKIWLNISFILQDNYLIPVHVGNYNEQVKLLNKILNHTLLRNAELIKSDFDYEITTNLQFPNDWGLGSSSTLISNLSKWAKIDAFDLLFNTLEGSGYDVATALEQKPVIYNLLPDKKPEWKSVLFNPSFRENLYFVHLNQKQYSEIEVSKYLKNKAWKKEDIERISEITCEIIKCNDLGYFEELINEHERIISKVLGVLTIKEKLFADYKGNIKSLGAWGGDFVLATRSNALSYFVSKGFNTILTWDEMVLR